MSRHARNKHRQRGGRSWTDRTQPIRVGDQVAYSKRYLQSTGQLTGDMPILRGTVIEMTKLGDKPLAVVDWHDGTEPQKVLATNLCQVKHIAFDA